MQTFSKHACAALLGLVVMASCSRPVAYFQRGPVEHYKTNTTIAAATPVVETTPAVVVAETPATAVATPVASPSDAAVANAEVQLAQAKTTMNEVEAYVRNDNKLASNKKLTKRMERVKTMLNSVSAQKLATTASTKKASLMEKMVAKRLDKQLKNKLAPESPAKAMARSMLTIGVIVAVAGLLLLLIGNGAGVVIGGIALVVGLILILLDLLA
jgi:DNA primase